jgi:serine/threonine protein kinase
MAPIANHGSVLLDGLQLPERYEISRRIATGGMATVWCARDRILGRDVAIKLLSDPYAHDSAAIRRFKREARTAARLSGHPHVVTIYDVGEAVDPDEPLGRAFMVMEFLAGGSVADALRASEITHAKAIRWLRDAAAALDFAHGRGVIHRDVKPANFLLDSARVLHVADFGIAQVGGEETIGSAGQILGTAAYLAPERALGHPATEASDRYSLAVAAFELLTGERPFRADHFAAQARAHVEDEPPRASRIDRSLPRALDGILVQGMAKRPEDRPTTATGFVDALERALRQQAPRGTRTLVLPMREHGRRAALGSPADERRRPRGIALAALLAAVIGLGIAAFLSNQGTSHTSSVHAARPTHPQPRSTTSTTTKRHPETTTTATTTASVAPSSADALEARGHQLMLAGDYASAIPILREVLNRASPGSLTYAYALFDLGRSLRLAGDPRAAIPLLYQRLQIPDQTETVRSELQAALRALGAQASGSKPATPPSSGPPGQRKKEAKPAGNGGPGPPGDHGD